MAKLLSPKFYEEMTKLEPRYPTKVALLLPALHAAQDELGWLSPETMEEIGSYIGIHAAQVKEVASFYTMYNLKPTGKFKLTLCTNLPCQLQGAMYCAEHAKKALGVDFGETTADGMFTLKEGECFGACGDAPVFTVNNHDIRAKITPEQFDVLTDELRRTAASDMKKA